MSYTPEQARAILEERARELARSPLSPVVEERLEVVVFALAQERYALETEHVREVLPLVDLALVPGGPDFLVGVINLRGQLLPIVDPRKILGLATRGLSDQAVVVVLGNERAEFGILVDAVQAVTALPTQSLRELPETVGSVAAGYLRGVTSDALILIDGTALLRDPRLIVDQGD